MQPAGYSGTPLPKKLGIKAGAFVVTVDAPAEAFQVLLPLPEGSKVSQLSLEDFAPCQGQVPDLVLWFVTGPEALGSIERVGRLCPGGCWILWLKKASPRWTGMTEDAVRNAGLAVGLVDYKVCAFDADWSGLRFAWRKGS